jgi:uncharacterized protein (TIGR02145 family)
MKTKNKIWLYASVVVLFLYFLPTSCKKTDKTPTVSENDTTVTDIDNNTYKIVHIGNQVWMAQNLRVTKYSNGDPVPTSTADVSTETEPKYQWAVSSTDSLAKVYGRLYTWYVVTDVRNICPANWHVPTDAELEALKAFLGGESVAANKIKEAGTAHWQTPNTGATNETKFTALPAGYRTKNGAFVSLHLSNYLWSSSQDSLFGLGQSLHFDDQLLLRGGYYRAAGVSVRCLRN